ncbi:MAG: integrase core domain-containing protein [Thermoplasmata archaeon]|nr:integrase core domain-containing protein [Thermoplasmata archaeon]
MALAYLREKAREAPNNLGWACNGGRKPNAIHVDSGSGFVSKEFREFCRAHGVSVNYRLPYDPRGRAKLERFRGILTQGLVEKGRFRSPSQLRRELFEWRGRHNRARIHGGIGWTTPYEACHDPKLTNKMRVRSR